ncbi:MAG: chemotaxis response regulator protein-glutamate methylesterase [Chromatiales bacterium]|jgi:two-component system chemotaxis response regulator CheB
MGQKVDVLVVDDSAFFRHRITEVLQQSPQLNVIGTAANGREAVEKTLQLKPDVITMDVEMPVMDGIEAVRQIMAKLPTPILMFSSLTSDGARVTLDALDAGAVDFLSKNFSPKSTFDEAYVLLREKVSKIAARTNRKSLARTSPTKTAAAGSERVRAASQTGRYKLVVIGASTGGPVALQTVLSKLPASFPLPIVVMVHMPAAFTPAYASRLNDLCKIRVKEATDRDALTPGQALLAPGGMQLLVEKSGSSGYVEVKQSLPEQTYKPSVDVGFGSAALSFGRDVLAIVLTGMGSDGKMGAQKLKQAGATVWSQNEASCVVYGMPQAVEKAGLSDRVLAIDEIGEQLAKAV